MKNLLYLHEAIAVVLLSKHNRTATIEDIASTINKRGLYTRKDKTPLPAYHVMLRTKLSMGKYSKLFKFFEDGRVKLV